MREFSPVTAFWTTPCILLASVLIAWGAEAAQFFIAQGFALAILAWLQTLPEFAVEAVLAWHQQRDLLLANLTGALRLLRALRGRSFMQPPLSSTNGEQVAGSANSPGPTPQY